MLGKPPFGGDADIGVRRCIYQVSFMNTFFALAVGGLLLFIVCRSTFGAWKLGSAEMSANDRRVALDIVVAVVAAVVETVLILQYSRR